jgi:hypothetical protein
LQSAGGIERDKGTNSLRAWGIGGGMAKRLSTGCGFCCSSRVYVCLLSNAISTLDQSSPHILGTGGNEVWETGAWTQTLKGETFGPLQLKGYHSSIAVLDGGVWKKRLLMWNITPAPATTKTAAVETK